MVFGAVHLVIHFEMFGLIRKTKQNTSEIPNVFNAKDLFALEHKINNQSSKSRQ